MKSPTTVVALALFQMDWCGLLSSDGSTLKSSCFKNTRIPQAPGAGQFFNIMFTLAPCFNIQMFVSVDHLSAAKNKVVSRD